MGIRLTHVPPRLIILCHLRPSTYPLFCVPPPPLHELYTYARMLIPANNHPAYKASNECVLPSSPAVLFCTCGGRR